MKGSMESFVVKTTKSDKEEYDELVAKFIYSSNSPFLLVENEHFVNLIQKLHPGYSPPSRQAISQELLDNVYEKEHSKTVANFLTNTTVCLSLDGWSNIHNDPIVCTSVTTEDGKSVLLDTIDTSGHPHTAEYLVTIAENSIKKFENEYESKVGSVVTDNTGNVAKMRRELNKLYPNLITYGCSAHLLNLLIQDLQIPGLKANLVKIIKFFRNNHFAAAKYKQSKAPKLTLPSDIRWNSFVDALEIYIKYWPVIMTICEENRKEIDSDIRNLVMNMVLKRNCEDLLLRMKPIAVALDRLQRTSSTIADSTQAWKILEEELTVLTLPESIGESFLKRKNQALSPVHYLANVLHPVYQGEKLSSTEIDEAMQFAANKSIDCASFLPTVMKFKGKSGPFLKELFKEETVSVLTAVEWWKSLKNQIDLDSFQFILQMLTCASSTAGLERLFSKFGIVHTDLRNKLGTKKAGKLVFLLGALNKK